MIGAVIGILTGILFAFAADIHISPAYSIYMAVAVLAAMDAAVGAIVSIRSGKFSFKIFSSGVIFSGIVSVLLVYVGKLIGIELSLAPIVLFGTRILKNFSLFRRFLLNKYKKKVTIDTDTLQ